MAEAAGRNPAPGALTRMGIDDNVTVTAQRRRKKFADKAPMPLARQHALRDRLGAVATRLSESRLSTAIFAALFVVLSFLYFPSWGGGDSDLWWHFALGRHYLSNATLKVDHAIFSWTPADSGWIYNTWLGSVIAYLCYTTAGGFGLWLFQWTVFAAIFLLFRSFIRSVQGKLDINALALLLMAVMAEGLALVYPKPELFTPLLFVGVVFLFFSVKRNRMSPRGFYLYPAMFAFWVNLHGGFIVGMGVVAILFATECLNYRFVKREGLTAQGLLHLGSSLLLSGAACLLNPYGWSYPWDTLTVTFPFWKQLAGEGGSMVISLIAYYDLWSYLFAPDRPAWWTAAWVMVLFLGLFLLISLAAFRKKGFLDISLLFLNPFLFYYGMSTVRAGIFFPTFALFSLYHTLDKAGFLARAKRFTLVSAVLFLSLGAIVLIKLTETPSFNFFGMHLEETVPVKEVELIRKWKLPPPLFNDYTSGGYMLWSLYPQYKVFIDSRGKPYDLTHLLGEYAELMENPTRENLQRLRSRYPFRVALIHLLYMDTILGILDSAGDEWRLLSFDTQAAILIHKSLLPEIGAEALSAIDRDPARFREVKSPETLSRLFMMYIVRGSGEASVIRDIYARNVSPVYRHKKRQLATMDEILRERGALERESLPLQRKVDK